MSFTPSRIQFDSLICVLKCLVELFKWGITCWTIGIEDVVGGIEVDCLMWGQLYSVMKWGWIGTFEYSSIARGKSFAVNAFVPSALNYGDVSWCKGWENRYLFCHDWGYLVMKVEMFRSGRRSPKIEESWDRGKNGWLTANWSDQIAVSTSGTHLP